MQHLQALVILLVLATSPHPANASPMTCATIRGYVQTYGLTIEQMKPLAARYGYVVTEADWKRAERCLHPRKHHWKKRK